jgi:hypothetical protein
MPVRARLTGRNYASKCWLRVETVREKNLERLHDGWMSVEMAAARSLALLAIARSSEHVSPIAHDPNI